MVVVAVVVVVDLAFQRGFQLLPPLPLPVRTMLESRQEFAEVDLVAAKAESRSSEAPDGVESAPRESSYSSVPSSVDDPQCAAELLTTVFEVLAPL